MRRFEKTAFFAVVGFGLLLMSASQGPFGGGFGGAPITDPKPTFSAFAANTNEVCLNWGLPVVTISYTIDPDGWNNPATLCTQFLIAPDGPFLHETNNHRCLDAGASGTMPFNVLNVFNDAPPAEFEVMGRLKPRTMGDIFYTAKVTVKTANCESPGNFPN